MTRAEVRAGALGAVLIALLAAGCLGRSPRPEFYNLTATHLGGTPVASLPELGLAVGAIEFPRYLDRPEIMTRDGANRLVPAPAQRWGGSLRSEVQRVLVVLVDDLHRQPGGGHRQADRQVCRCSTTRSTRPGCHRRSGR